MDSAIQVISSTRGKKDEIETKIVEQKKRKQESIEDCGSSA
jgi:hypothetical protein